MPKDIRDKLGLKSGNKLSFKLLPNRLVLIKLARVPTINSKNSDVMNRRVLLALFLIAACARITWATESFNTVKQGFRPSDTLILASNGEVIQRLRTDNTVRRGQWVALADVSPALRTALVLSEDKRFYEHSGVDWRAVSSAAWANLWNTKTRGASTISMQLAGLLDEDLKAGAGEIGRASCRERVSRSV